MEFQKRESVLYSNRTIARESSLSSLYSIRYNYVSVRPISQLAMSSGFCGTEQHTIA